MGAESEALNAAEADAKRILKPWTMQWRERTATVISLAFLLGGGLYVWLNGPTLAVTSGNPALAVPTSACAAHPVPAHPVKVSDASGATAALTIFIGRGGHAVQRESSPLAMQGDLPPGTTLCTASTDLVRSDGETLPSSQVASWAVVGNDEAHVTLFVVVAPRYGFVSGFGGYSGTVSLNDPRAIGADIPVSVHVEYYNLAHPIAWALVAAFGGFIWAWFIHNHVLNPSDPQPFLASLTLRVAVLLVAAVPVINAQVLTNPDWQGSLTQYITLASLAGAAAIAVTPTLRVITTSSKSGTANSQNRSAGSLKAPETK